MYVCVCMYVPYTFFIGWTDFDAVFFIRRENSLRVTWATFFFENRSGRGLKIEKTSLSNVRVSRRNTFASGRPFLPWYLPRGPPRKHRNWFCLLVKRLSTKFKPGRFLGRAALKKYFTLPDPPPTEAPYSVKTRDSRYIYSISLVKMNMRLSNGKCLYPRKVCFFFCYKLLFRFTTV